MTGRQVVGDVIGLGGVAMVLGGVWQIWPPAGLILAGLLALWIGYRMAGGAGASHA